MKPNKARKFKGFAALNKRGDLIWGTLSRTQEQAQEKHDRFNPDATGAGMGETIAEVDIYIKT